MVGLFIHFHYLLAMHIVDVYFVHIEKLGRTEAEQLYREKLIPAIQVRHNRLKKY